MFLSHQLQKIICFMVEQEKRQTDRERLSWGMKESEGFVYPQLLRCQGQEAGMSRWPTWDVTLSGRRPKGKTPGDLNKIHHITEIALRCQLGTGSKRCHSNAFELMDAQRHSWQDFT